MRKTVHFVIQTCHLAHLAFSILFKTDVIAIAKTQDGGQKSVVAANATNTFCDE